MTIRNLEHAVRPRSLAIIGASGREGSVGRVVLENVLHAGFEGDIWPVNPKYRELSGRPCHARVRDLPGIPDLAVIVTPAATVPGLITELGALGTRAAVVISAGLTRENGLRQAMLDAAKPHLFRIIGPNTLGLMIPPLKLNAGFAHMAARPGGIALLSQSGAIASSLIDWAAENDLGFSHIVSLGDMADVDVGDWLDILAGDAATRTIMLYLESVSSPRKFLSAARAAARVKPVIAVKAGRHEASAKAAATHTGALSGGDRVFAAALSRAGILRVGGLSELFDAAEITARFRPMESARVGIVTNGGGAGVLAVDRLVDLDGELAELVPETLARLDAVLPATWSKANPVDIIGDAPPERYTAAIRAVADDPGTDIVLAINCPTGLASPLGAARAVASLTSEGMIGRKPVLSCWLGEHTARQGRSVLQEAGVPSFATPADAAAAVSYLSGWSRAQRALLRVPSAHGDALPGDRQAVLSIFRQAAGEGRRMLTEPEAKAAVSAYGIEVPETAVAPSPEEAQKAAARLLASSDKIVVKLLSRAISHKSDVGGVVLDIDTPQAAREAAEAILRRVSQKAPGASVDGFAVQPMVVRRQAQELILGLSIDPVFGPAVLFGAGGIAVEVMNDTAVALPPLDDVLAGDLIDRTRVGRLLAGFRDRKPADRAAIVAALGGLSQMIVDFPCIASMDINPLLADAEGVVALDARVEIDPGRVEEGGPNPDLAIRPYPTGWATRHDASGKTYQIRPIRPSDVDLYPDFVARVSQHDIRMRFLAPRMKFADEMLRRLTQLDYDREMAFVALAEPSGELAGIGRLSSDPDKAAAEYGLIVRTDLQGQGLGKALLSRILDFARAEGVRVVEGLVLAENDRMISICRQFGFEVRYLPEDPGLVRVSLPLGGWQPSQSDRDFAAGLG